MSCKNKEAQKLQFNVQVPTAGNAWVLENNNYIQSDILTKDGIQNWDNNKIRTYVYFKNKGNLSLGLTAKTATKNTKIKVSFNNTQKEISLTNTKLDSIFIGNYQIEKEGYYNIDLELLEENASINIKDVLIGILNTTQVLFIKDEFYWGRRGPSVHLNYLVPKSVENIEWFYSELMIPKGQDVIGSYYMANGFSGGYFGIQANSKTERRILFSIWSPYKTDKPSEIPEAYKIKLLKKGNEVHSGEFGNEGSGGQSYKVFSWKTGINYGFLIGSKPTKNNSTIYTAYFYNSEENKWNLIAQFKRPKTHTYLKGLYSFLENFIPEQGVYDRKGLFSNQWVYNKNGWHELNKIKFTADNTARKQNRLDYSGGIENNVFYLKNCGFTNDNIEIGTTFERIKTGKQPQIDFNKFN
ncbi:DUF3472 domain-containing protein [Polaribacter huanghezhanensis]|uniref:DUF3472 domain-containing protein n=1 Tax=Polaribacter huanghezhanensis TaxID=1354726 RepID=UPI0026498CA0|nr:DUF3472 domain-containing protein [Polaribacter huanghezhanensis]